MCSGYEVVYVSDGAASVDAIDGVTWGPCRVSVEQTRAHSTAQRRRACC